MAKAKSVNSLKCGADAAAGARLVLMSRVHEMISLSDKALEWSDPEGVHDMRVASRRLRSALRDFRNIFRKRDLVVLSRESKILADCLGEVRDEDVAIISLEELRLGVAPEARAGLELLIAERVERRQTARLKLTKTITPQRLAKLSQLFVERVGVERIATDAVEGISGKPTLPFRDLGGKRIGEQFGRFAKRAACLYRPSASAELHELRIEAKRLRYALELFGVCWNDQLTLFTEQIAEMQGALGDLHDYDEWIDQLGNKLATYHELERKAPRGTAGEAEGGGTKNACIWLLDNFTKERTKSYRQALALWTNWQSSSFAANLYETLAKVEERPV